MDDDTQTLDLFPDEGAEAAPIEQHASHAYLGYAVSTVKARALPEIADGLKPVQRRILYAMGEAGGGGFAKCSRYAELMLAEIGEGTVDFVKNYDGKFEEPALLPARLPFGLLNGSFGIPVGFSTRIPSHNLKEVAAAAAHVIKHPRAKIEDILEHIPGPDFPGGGQIISPPDEIRQAYETGRGSLVLKA